MPKFNQYEVAVSSFNNVELFNLAFIIPMKRIKKIHRALPQPAEWVKRPVSVVTSNRQSLHNAGRINITLSKATRSTAKVQRIPNRGSEPKG